jgi:hypothetical protein
MSYLASLLFAGCLARDSGCLSEFHYRQNCVITLDHSFNIVHASIALMLLHFYAQSWNLAVSYSLKLLPAAEAMLCCYLI